MTDAGAAWAYRAGLNAGTLLRIREKLSAPVPRRGKVEFYENLFSSVSDTVEKWYNAELERNERPTSPTYQLADFDGTDDAADWLTEGHVLTAQEVEWLRNLKVVGS